MTPPMTPREKVARIVDPAAFLFSTDELVKGDTSQYDALRKADAILTALASGSGDHAELEVVAWRVKHPRHDAHRLCFVPAATDEAEPLVAAASAEALLAENAALRDREKAAIKECSEWARQAGEAIGKLEASEVAGVVEDWRVRATEAERKLAEAVGLNERAADLMRQCTDPERFEGASTLNVYANMRAWLSDLSKEAERG